MNDNLVCDLNATWPAFSLNLNFTVKKGELVCIIGPSGCGKSTTLSLIAGLLDTTDCSIRLDGKELKDLPPEKRGVAMVFQSYALFPHMSVAENIAYPMKLRKTDRKTREERVEYYLSLVSLPGFGDRKPDQLSGGESQRVALARALASEPSLLLLDEPLSALDAALRQKLREEIKRIHDETGITMLYVTHDRSEAMAIADTVLVMKDGKLAQQGTPEELYHTPCSPFVATFTGEGNLIHTPGSTLFFRPEHLHPVSETEKVEPMLLLKGCSLVSSIFSGWFRINSWNYQGQIIRSYSRTKPATNCETLAVGRDKLLKF